MKHFTTPPKEIAKLLVEEGFTIEKYEKIQEERLRRVKTFEEAKIPVLIKEAKKLVKYGEEILKHMKKLTVIIVLFTLISCGYNAIDNSDYVIITDIESDNNCGSTMSGTFKEGCFYYVQGHTHHRIERQSYFFDMCGKFTVGDTIRIVKK